MAFHDVRIPTSISAGARGGPMFSNPKVTTSSGWRQTNMNWEYPLHRYDLSSVLKNRTKREEAKAFFILRGGDAHSFRFKDHADYLVGYAMVNGALVFTAEHDFAVGDGSTTDFQLAKVYSDAAATLSRPITKPVTGTVRIFLNGVEALAGWTVDTDTGIVSFDVAPGLGVVISWAGQFDLEVQLDDPAMMVELDSPTTGDWSFAVSEVR